MTFDLRQAPSNTSASSPSTSDSRERPAPLRWINKLLEMTEHFKAVGDADLAEKCRATANKMLDALAFEAQKGGAE